MKAKAKFEFDEEEENTNQNPSHNLPVANSDDDEEGNEDLSLEIIQKAMARASQAAAAAAIAPVDAGTSNPAFGDDTAAAEPVASKIVKKKTVKVKKNRKKAKKLDTETETVTMAKEEEILGITKGEEVVKISEADAIDDNSDNAILRSLLRGPRYFDPPDKSWGACYNCGEEGHSAVNCTLARRKKPCFICGSLEHEAKQCQKDCFICKGGGHRAKDCPRKFKRCLQASELCLKCGAAAHALSSCNNDYSLDDLKEIQCYVCKRFGHLCCADYSDALPSEASCYKCGQLGHNGQECRGARGGTSTGTPSSCFRCGEEGHFARECTNSVKAKKRCRDLSTPTGKRPKESKSRKGLKSAPQELGKAKAHKKKLQFDNGSPDWLSKSKRRGGWITDDAGDLPCERRWRSPSTPKTKHKIYSLTNAGKDSSSQSSKQRTKFGSGTSSSQGYAKVHRQSFSASRFGNYSSDGTRRNYDWW